MTTAVARSTLIFTLTLLLLGTRTARAQQAFEDKYVAAPAGSTDLVPLPTIGIVPVATVPLDADVAAQLSEAVQREAARDQRSEVLTRPSGSKTSWAFVVRNAPRAMHDAFTPLFTDQLLRCMHSLEVGVELATLHLLLVTSHVGDEEERDNALAAGAQMLANWKSDQCQVRRNDLPFLDANRPRLAAATRGMLTELFDLPLFPGLGLLDVIDVLYPLYFHPGGFWTSEMTPRLHATFAAGVRAGLFTTDETSHLADREQRTFWDWLILALSTKPTIARSVIEHTAAGCVTTVPGLRYPFVLSRCVSDGALQLITLRVAGQDYTTVQRVRP